MTKEQTIARNILIDIIRHPYCWPGGYEKLAITKDGGILCSKCCKSEASQIMGDIQGQCSTGWHIDGVTYEAVSADCCDDELTHVCDHCNREFGEFGC